MGGPRDAQRGGGPGGIAAAAPELQDAVNAVLLQADWRPVMGLTDTDQGSLIERVLTVTVLEAAVAQHNKSIESAKHGK